jgi:glycosyltransferase involved in cell wall biosynthesis
MQAEGRLAMSPAVAVVIPLHDKRDFLMRAVRSVLQQSWRDLELVVVDDASTDGGADLLRDLGDARLRCLRIERCGPGAARNVGARLGHSRWIAFLDADDEWQPSFLEKAVAAMHTAPETVLVYCDMRARDASARRLDVGSGVIDDYFAMRMAHSIAVSCSSNLVRRDAFERSGGFREDTRYAEDIDTWLRLACLGPFYFIAEALSVIEVAHPARITRVAGALERAQGLGQVYVTYQEQLARGAIPAAQRAGFRRFVQHLRGIEAVYLAHAGRRRDAWRTLREAPLGSHTWRSWSRCLLRLALPGAGDARRVARRSITRP